MYYKIQIDWNKCIILPMNKDTAAAVNLMFGDVTLIYSGDYERDIGSGLVNANDWRPAISVLREDEFKEAISIGEKIANYRDGRQRVMEVA